MNINISKLLSEKTESIDIDFNYDLKNSILSQDYNIIEASPINFSGKIYMKDDNIFLDATYSGEIVFRCSRCLEDFKKNISGDIEFDIPVVDDEENEDSFIEDDNLNLSTIIEEALAFSLPMKILCSEECKGLCSSCGQNLNKKQCDCDVDDIDPRMEKLKNFFSNNEEV